MISTALLLLTAALVKAHGDHTFDLDDAGDIGMSYAERHVSFISSNLLEEFTDMVDAHRTSY